MKEKILGKLKQVYAQLGLGDAILSGLAESLASLGFVTDENLDAVIAAQKGYLEGLQKANDSRVNDAVKKAKEAAKKEFEEATKKAKEAAEKEEAERKAKEEAERKAKEEAERKAKEEAAKEEAERDPEPEWFKAYRTRIEAAQNEKAKEYDALKQELDKLQKDYDGAKAEAKKKARSEFILSKAKELGVPQYRIDEGFAIAEDASEEAITTKLTTIANNIKANSLPQDKRFLMGDDTPSKEEVASIAKALVR